MAVVATELTSPSALSFAGTSCTWYGNYLAVGYSDVNGLNLYKRTGSSIEKLTISTPGIANGINDCSWSEDGYLAVTTGPANYLFKLVDDDLVSLSFPAGTSNARACSWSGDYLVVIYASGPYINLYKKVGDTLSFASTPATIPAGSFNSCSWSGDYLVVGYDISPFIALYKREEDVLTKLSDVSAAGGDTRGLSWSGDYLAAAHLTSPYITTYKRSGDTLTELATMTALSGIGFSCSWYGNYLAVGHSTSPYLDIYERTGDTFEKLTAPTSPPEGDGNGVAWGGQYLVVAHATTPHLSFYSTISDIPGKELYYNSALTGLLRIEVSTDLTGNGLFIPMSDGAYRVVQRGDQVGTIKIGSDSLSEIA